MQARNTNAPEVSIIMPAYREERVVGGVVRRVREVLAQSGRTHEVIVIDDGSDDGTAAAAAAAGARVLRRPRNLGNGSAVKAGLRAARGRYSVLMDADGQHRPEDLPRLLARLPEYDMVVGARSSDTPQAFHRGLANKAYNRFASYIAEYEVEDLTSGFRAFKTAIVRRFLYLLPNRFSYPTTITLSMIRAGHAVCYLPIYAPPRVGKSKIRPLRDGFRFLMIMWKIGTLFAPLRLFLPVSGVCSFTGLSYAIYFMKVHGHFSNGGLVLCMTGLSTFLMAMVAQQIAALHFQRSDGALLEDDEAAELPGVEPTFDRRADAA